MRKIRRLGIGLLVFAAGVIVGLYLGPMIDEDEKSQWLR